MGAGQAGQAPGPEVGGQRYMPAGEAVQGAPKRYETVDSFREHWNSLGVRNMTDIRGRGTPYEHIRPSEIEVEKAAIDAFQFEMQAGLAEIAILCGIAGHAVNGHGGGVWPKTF